MYACINVFTHTHNTNNPTFLLPRNHHTDPLINNSIQTINTLHKNNNTTPTNSSSPRYAITDLNISTNAPKTNTPYSINDNHNPQQPPSKNNHKLTRITPNEPDQPQTNLHHKDTYMPNHNLIQPTSTSLPT